MRLVLTAKALEVALSGVEDFVIDGIVYSARLGVTSKILQDYNDMLGKNQIFQDWFSAMQQHRRFQTVPEQMIRDYGVPSFDTLHQDYPGSAYCAGLLLAIFNREGVSDALRRQLMDWGIRVIEIEQFPKDLSERPPADNPLKSLSYERSQTANIGEISVYLSMEKDVVIYDKFLNDKTINTISALLAPVTSRAEVKIVTQARPQPHCKSARDACSELRRLLPHLLFTPYEATSATTRDNHDRYIHVGDRFEIHFSGGLDKFKWQGGRWIASDCVVTVYNVMESVTKREFNCVDGTTIARKMCVG